MNHSRTTTWTHRRVVITVVDRSPSSAQVLASQSDGTMPLPLPPGLGVACSSPETTLPALASLGSLLSSSEDVNKLGSNFRFNLKNHPTKARLP